MCNTCVVSLDTSRCVFGSISILPTESIGLVRDCEENLADFAQYPGVIVLLGIMLSPAKRLQLKALFLLRSILSAEKTTGVCSLLSEKVYFCMYRTDAHFL